MPEQSNDYRVVVFGAGNLFMFLSSKMYIFHSAVEISQSEGTFYK